MKTAGSGIGVWAQFVVGLWVCVHVKQLLLIPELIILKYSQSICDTPAGFISNSAAACIGSTSVCWRFSVGSFIFSRPPEPVGLWGSFCGCDHILRVLLGDVAGLPRSCWVRCACACLASQAATLAPGSCGGSGWVPSDAGEEEEAGRAG